MKRHETFLKVSNASKMAYNEGVQTLFHFWRLEMLVAIVQDWVGSDRTVTVCYQANMAAPPSIGSKVVFDLIEGVVSGLEFEENRIVVDLEPDVAPDGRKFEDWFQLEQVRNQFYWVE
jgi:hypothetical protein